jgi:hypothetical protein
MSIFRNDSLQFSFLDEIFTDDFPELPSILNQPYDIDFDQLSCSHEPLDYPPNQESAKPTANKGRRKSRWTEADDAVIIDLVEKYGHSWKYFTTYLPNRPADSIKSRYYSYLKKKHQPQPCANLPHSKPYFSSYSRSDDFVVDSMLDIDVAEAASTCSQSLSETSKDVLKEDGRKALLKRLYAKMSSLEKVLARTYLEIDRLQSSKGQINLS